MSGSVDEISAYADLSLTGILCRCSGTKFRSPWFCCVGMCGIPSRCSAAASDAAMPRSAASSHGMECRGGPWFCCVASRCSAAAYPRQRSCRCCSLLLRAAARTSLLHDGIECRAAALQRAAADFVAARRHRMPRCCSAASSSGLRCCTTA